MLNPGNMATMPFSKRNNWGLFTSKCHRVNDMKNLKNCGELNWSRHINVSAIKTHLPLRSSSLDVVFPIFSTVLGCTGIDLQILQSKLS